MKNGTRLLRNLATGSMVLAMASVAMAQAMPAKKKFDELSYAHYKIYAQVYSSHENGAVTYMITHHPDRRVVIAYGTFGEQARMAASKSLKRCMENSGMFIPTEQRLPELRHLIATAEASPAATASLTGAEKRQLAQNKQIVAFYADSEGMPQYACFGNSYRLPADSVYE